MTFVEAIKTCFSKYATFTGRASRAEFWWWALFNLIVQFLVSWLCDLDVETYVENIQDGDFTGAYTMLFTQCWPSFVVGLFFLLPNLAVSIRRLHDTNRSGWWIVLLFIPCIDMIAAIVLLVFWCLPGNPEPNYYGVPPLK